MKAEELRNMSTEELRHQLDEYKQELFNLRFQVATRKIKNVERISAVKKDIARILTILRERELIAEYLGAEAAEVASAPTDQQAPRRRGLLGRLRRG
jgi:large subunit ribosomal protein L29